MARATMGWPRLGLAAAGAALVFMGVAGQAAPDQPAASAAQLATMLMAVESTPTERMLDGTVEAVNQSTVSAQTAGRVTDIYFDVNDLVPAGALHHQHPQHRAGAQASCRPRRRSRKPLRARRRRRHASSASATCTSAASSPRRPTTRPAPPAMPRLRG